MAKKIPAAVTKAFSAFDSAFAKLKKALGIEAEEVEETEEEEEETEEDEEEEEEEEEEESEEDEEDEDEDEGEEEEEEEESEDEEEEDEEEEDEEEGDEEEEDEEEGDEEEEDEEEGDEEEEEEAEEEEDDEDGDGDESTDPIVVATKYVAGLAKQKGKNKVEITKASITKLFKTRWPSAALKGIDGKKWPQIKAAQDLLKANKPKTAFIKFTELAVDDDGGMHGWDEVYLRTGVGAKSPTPCCSALPMDMAKEDDGTYTGTDRATGKKYKITVTKDEDGELMLDATPVRAKAKADKPAKVKKTTKKTAEKKTVKKTTKPSAKKGAKVKKVKRGKK